MARGKYERELACLFFESYWEKLNKAVGSKRKRADMAYALIEAFFTGESQADQFTGEAWGTYESMEERVFYSKAQAEKGRAGGKAKKKAKPEAELEAEMEANGKPNTKTKEIKKEKEKKEVEAGFVVCPRCHSECDIIESAGLAHCPSCDITWRCEG